MKAISFLQFGDADVLQLQEVSEPALRPSDLLVRVAGAGVNRADILFRNGDYGWANFGDSGLMGLEMAGEVVAMGAEVKGFTLGDKVMGITGGGSYAQICRLDYRMALPVPEGSDLVAAGGIMEAFVTAHEALVHLARLQSGEKVLIHAASGGVGSAAVQLAHASGAQVFFTAAPRTHERLKALGGDAGIDYAGRDFQHVLAHATDGKGVDVILDFIGGPNLEKNVRSLAKGGRLVQIGLMSGEAIGRLPLDLVLFRCLRIMGTVMKSRTQEEKQAMVRRFGQRWLGELSAGKLKPVIEERFALSRAADAHRRMEAGSLFGKLVLVP